MAEERLDPKKCAKEIKNYCVDRVSNGGCKTCVFYRGGSDYTTCILSSCGNCLPQSWGLGSVL